MRIKYRKLRTRFDKNLISNIVDTESNYGSNRSEPV